MKRLFILLLCLVFSISAYADTELDRTQSKAENGDAMAQVQMGAYYAAKGNENYKPEKAFKWFSQAAGQNNPYGNYFTGKAYLEGEGVEKNEGKGIALLKKAAKQKLPDAFIELGNYYYSKKNYSEAIQYYEDKILSKMVIYDDINPVCIALGNIYFDGLGTKQNHKKAIVYYKDGILSAIGEDDKPKITKQEALGGLGFVNDAQVASTAVTQKSMIIKISNKIAAAYKTGDGVGQDDDMYIKWLKRAALAGDNEAAYTLGVIYDNGTNGANRNPEKAQEYYMMGAYNNDPDCTEKLNPQNADQIANNLYNNKDYIAAIKLYTRSADGGNVYAQKMLGDIYSYGQIITPDIPKARKYYSMAAAQQDYGAQQRLNDIDHQEAQQNSKTLNDTAKSINTLINIFGGK